MLPKLSLKLCLCLPGPGITVMHRDAKQLSAFKVKCIVLKRENKALKKLSLQEATPVNSLVFNAYLP